MPDDAARQHCPIARELDDLELLLTGAYAPLDRYDHRVRLDAPAGPLELVDPEGFPLAHRGADGALNTLGRPEYGPFRRLHLTPAQVRECYDGALFVPVDTCLSTRDITELSERRRGRPVVLLALCGEGTSRGIGPVGLVRVTLAAAALLGDAHVVAVPLPRHDDAELDAELRGRIVANFAAGEVFADVTGEGPCPAELSRIIEQDRPEKRGVVVFFTGLSGSGKSTLARALCDCVLEHGGRTVTSLDGDVVRRNLSAGLSFSKADRETNIRRIGWVAAEIARHGGVAICSPIAPFDATRKAVREMVLRAGGRFVLVHVATPLEECERRDRKGLYRRARAGRIPDFTGISSPYEEPEDATVRVDTTGRTIEDALAEVLAALPFRLDR
ncbi:adenylyl-sulfate kinase [Actinomadura sp. CNU-125]|uniref:adenylyl-sulfate kinase n=1 Tax=Actinomadura sp. CNU-125 TaxID=1904961 RepID=UPI000960A50D|nr:adenylyl-sulfate kinase [Actinomadura sp. CNU-125]OLT33918.1 adenylyl-sulfate kinase [Actinomadura sp. CNU-125]